MHEKNMTQLMAAIQQGKTRFLQSLPQRVGAISLVVSGLSEREGAQGEARQLFHALSGTAGTYGLSAVAALCSEAEEVCDVPSFGREEEAYLSLLVRDLRARAGGAAEREHRDAAVIGSEMRHQEWQASV